MSADLTGKRVLILGAETEIGRAVTTAVAEAGASLAAVATTSDAEAAFAVQRLARRLSSGERKVIAQAIDATNEAAVRVMVRQVSKDLGALDAVVYSAAIAHSPTFGERSQEHLIAMIKGVSKALARSNGRLVFFTLQSDFSPAEPRSAQLGSGWVTYASTFETHIVSVSDRTLEQAVSRVLVVLAGEPDSG